MRGSYRAVAIDYDGTLADGGLPGGEVLSALREVRRRGCLALLCTGRRLDDLLEAFPGVYASFDAVVAENGGVIVSPLGRRQLAAPVDPRLREALLGRGVRVRQGEVLLACDASDDLAVFEEVRRLDLDCQLVRNRGALMVLPAGVTKASGLEAALAELAVSPHSTVAIGDAENDRAMLWRCELGVAVANAVPLLLQDADLVLHEPDGPGVAGFLRGPIMSGARRARGARWRIQLGAELGRPVTLPSSQLNLLITGASLSGKSFLAGMVAEQLLVLGYSLLVVDPEGDHARLGELSDVLVAGADGAPPPPEQVVALAGRPSGGVVLDLSACSRDDAARYLRELPPLVGRQWAKRGLPHWALVEEAHGSLSTQGAAGDLLLPGAGGCILVTFRPDELCSRAREAVDAVLVLCGGERSGVGPVASAVADLAGLDPGRLAEALERGRTGQAILVVRDRPGRLVTFDVGGRLLRHVRHWHKYAVRELPAELRFLFRDGAGLPTGATAGSLGDFHRELVRCPPEGLRHHVRRRDFSRWVGDVFRDPTLAHAIEAVETAASDRDTPEALVRQELVGLIEERYLV